MARVTLSIDNGPDPEITPAVLDVLARREVAARFFVVGRRLAEAAGRRTVERASAEGHWIGNHSYSHEVPFGRNDSPRVIAEEVEATQALLGPLAHQDRLFRPFGGDGGALDDRLLSRDLVDHLEARRYTCVLWNAVPRDWEQPDAWVETAMAQVAGRTWALVVVHDIVPGAARQIDRFIGCLRDGGHEIVQSFPEDCVPIAGGETRASVEHLIGR